MMFLDMMIDSVGFCQEFKNPITVFWPLQRGRIECITAIQNSESIYVQLSAYVDTHEKCPYEKSLLGAHQVYIHN